MKLFKMTFFALFITLSIAAQANQVRPFECDTKLDYKVAAKVQTVDLELFGERSVTDTLVGNIFLRVGEEYFYLQAQSVSLSNNIILLTAADSREHISLSFRFLKNSDGSQNFSNKAYVEFSTDAGIVKGSNKNLGTGSANSSYPINCIIK